MSIVGGPLESLARHARLLTRPQLATAASLAAVMVAAGSLLAVDLTSGHAGGVDQLRVESGPSPSGPTAEALPTVSSTAAPVLTPSPSVMPTLGHGAGAQPLASAVGKASLPVRYGQCQGPLPHGHRAEPACDVGKHHGLPPGCRWDGNCAWWDSWGAVTGGPADVPTTVTPAGDLDVSWDVPSDQLRGNSVSGPIREFVVLVHNDNTDTVVWKHELGLNTRSTTISDLGPDTYTVCVYELNDSGLGGLCPGAVTIKAPPNSPPPSDSPTPAPSPTGTS